MPCQLHAGTKLEGPEPVPTRHSYVLDLSCAGSRETCSALGCAQKVQSHAQWWHGAGTGIGLHFSGLGRAHKQSLSAFESTDMPCKPPDQLFRPQLEEKNLAASCNITAY